MIRCLGTHHDVVTSEVDQYAVVKASLRSSNDIAQKAGESDVERERERDRSHFCSTQLKP